MFGCHLLNRLTPIRIWIGIRAYVFLFSGHEFDTKTEITIYKSNITIVNNIVNIITEQTKSYPSCNRSSS